jgi:hypothetical protein
MTQIYLIPPSSRFPASSYAAMYLLACMLISNVASAQSLQATPKPNPAKIIQVRSKPALVQELTMGPEGYELWTKIQELIEQPDLKDFARLVTHFDLQTKEPLDAVNWQFMHAGRRDDIKGKQHNPMIKAGRYGVGGLYPAPKTRQIFFEMTFDINQFCLSKQEIQRLYPTGWESAPTHSPNWGSQQNIGFYHGFGLKGRAGGFGISASGCAVEFSISQNLEEMKQEQSK